MPIAFPLPDRGPWYDVPGRELWQIPERFDITNLAVIGLEFDARALDPGFPIDHEPGRAVNLRTLGEGFVTPEWQGRMNPVPIPVSDAWFSFQQTGFSSFTLSGVSRDSTGAILGNCVIDLFLTGTDILQQSTVSDAAGNFWFSLMAPGPYYIVAYKAGSPDVTGATANTLQPV